MVRGFLEFVLLPGGVGKQTAVTSARGTAGPGGAGDRGRSRRASRTITSNGTCRLVGGHLARRNDHLRRRATGLGGTHLRRFNDARVRIVTHAHVHARCGYITRSVIRINSCVLFNCGIFVNLGHTDGVGSILSLCQLVSPPGGGSNSGGDRDTTSVSGNRDATRARDTASGGKDHRRARRRCRLRRISLGGAFLSRRTFIRSFGRLCQCCGRAQLVRLAIGSDGLLLTFRVNRHVASVHIFHFTLSFDRNAPRSTRVTCMSGQNRHSVRLPPTCSFS